VVAVDVNTGPTSIIGLLTAQIIKEVGTKGNYTATMIAVAVSFSVGIYSLIFGLLNLGFLLELVSLPVLTGFISAAALTIIIGQIPAIFGETNIGTGVANQVHDIFAKLEKTKLPTLAISITGILLLCILQLLGSRYGKTNKAVWLLSIGRNAIVIFLFTLISFAINSPLGSATPVFDLTGKIPSGLLPPKAPDLALVSQVFSPSLAVFIAAALEHIAIAKSFARKSNPSYTIDQSQELTFLGFANLFNSLLGGMPVGGAASRTAVNAESGVKSPLSGLFTGIVVLISIYALTGALFWIPKATLAAVIIVAVYQIIVPVKVFYGFWKVNFIDFAASMLAFWVTLFVSAEAGIEFATAFMLFATVLGVVFSKAKVIARREFQKHYPGPGTMASGFVRDVPEGIQIVRLEHPVLFLNATRTKKGILDAVMTFHKGVPSTSLTLKGSEKTNQDRLWNELGAQHIALLRRQAGISAAEADKLPLIKALVLDMEGVVGMDVSGVQAFKDTLGELIVFGGRQVEIRVVGLRDNIAGRLARAGVEVVLDDEGNKAGRFVTYNGIGDAVSAPLSIDEREEIEKEAVSSDEIEGEQV
jgi:sodium-independent sulfate anion transporter 11